VDVGQIIKDVLSIFRGKLNSRSVRVRIEGAESLQILGLPGELRQLFSNLLSNAIDASPTQSEIRIRLRDLGHSVQITMSDQGAGIPEATRAQVFEPFFTTKKDVGTGLGLWISKQIAEKHGGRVRFRSNTSMGRSGIVFVVKLQKDVAARNRAA
jgi:signal transduction histidine kinase